MVLDEETLIECNATGPKDDLERIARGIANYLKLYKDSIGDCYKR